MMDTSRTPPFPELGLNLLRIVSGFLFIQHGLQKTFGVPAGAGGAPSGIVPMASLPGAAGVIEIVCGTLIILGLFTRAAAFLASGEMAFAYFLVHAPRAFWPLINRGEVVVLYAFLFLFFATNGGGGWSLDGWLARRRKRSISAGTVRSTRIV